MQSTDPYQNLAASSVAARCAAIRALGTLDHWHDVPRLIEIAWQDRSIPVRLYAAATIADMAWRRRADQLSKEQRDLLVAAAFGGDPGLNPSMLMLASAVLDKALLERLGRVLREPRSDVRLGAVVAISRAALSARFDRDMLEDFMQSWLSDRRIQLDTQVELAKLAGDVGLQSLRAHLITNRSSSEAADAVLATSLERLAARHRQSCWQGLWLSDGLDVFEVGLSPTTPRLAVCSESHWHTAAGSASFLLGDHGVAQIGGQRAEIVWAIPLRQHVSRPVLLSQNQAWWSVPVDELPLALDTYHAQLRQGSPAVHEVVRACCAQLTGASAQRVALVEAWICGENDTLFQLCTDMLERKRPRNDAWYWRALVWEARGAHAEAIADLQSFLGKVKPSHALAPAAQALVHKISAV